MNRPPSRWLRVALWGAVAVQVVLVAGQAGVEAQLLGTEMAPEGGAVGLSINAVSLLAFPMVGGLLLYRRPEHRIGWLFCVANLGWVMNNFGSAYVRLDATSPDPAFPGVDLVVWLYTWPGLLAALVYILILATFPDGRLPSPRWRLLVWAALGWAVIAGIGAALAPGPVDATIGVEAHNPIGVGGAPGVLLAWIRELGFPLFAPLWVAAGLALVVRYRRAGLIERLQLKWFLSAVVASVIAISAFIGVGVYFGTVTELPAWARPISLAAILGVSVVIPVAAALAILRHGLYEIDRVISRTLSYAAITAVLVGIYFATVLLFGSLVGRGSDLAVAGSTLAVAAAFQPLRRRVQDGVDRRFNRSRYDAVHTVELFSQRLRDEVELEDLRDELSAVTTITMQPEHVSLWLRDEPRSMS